MLDYKDILNKRYVLRLSLREIAKQTGAGKSGVHDFLKAFEKCEISGLPTPSRNHERRDCHEGVWQSAGGRPSGRKLRVSRLPAGS